MIFYHRTTEEAWAAVQAEGVLWGIHPLAYRYTYLSASRDVDESYGSVLLEVEYEPVGRRADNYGFEPPPLQECWQFSVFVPIPLDRVRRVRRVR